jgi:hypothetical protein
MEKSVNSISSGRDVPVVVAVVAVVGLSRTFGAKVTLLFNDFLCTTGLTTLLVPDPGPVSLDPLDPPDCSLPWPASTSLNGAADVGEDKVTSLVLTGSSANDMVNVRSRLGLPGAVVDPGIAVEMDSGSSWTAKEG